MTGAIGRFGAELGPAIDLQALARVRPDLAEVGWILNEPRYGGANFDGNPLSLSHAEYQAAAPRLLRQAPHLRGAVGALAAYFSVAPSPNGGPALVSRAQVRSVGDGRQLDMMSAAVDFAPGRTLMVYDSSNPAFTQAGLYAAEIVGGEAGPKVPLFAGLPGLVAAPSAVNLEGRPWVYFLTAPSLDHPAQLFRAPIGGDGGVGAKEVLPAIPGVDSILSWPHVVGLPGGGAVVAFRDRASRPMLARSRDGVKFDPPELVGPRSGGAMATVAALTGGGLAYAYQVQTPTEPFVSYVRLNHGGPWSRPIRVTDQSPNVHDTTLLARPDGGVDLYYIYPAGDQGFSIFRRSLAPAGQLGPEQRITDDSVGDAMKPSAKRLADGRVLLSFAVGTARDAQGQPARQRLDFTILPGDAPA